MGKRTGLSSSITVCACFVFVFAVVLAFAVGVQAQPKEIEGIGYNVNATLADNLKSLIGKKVYVTLGSGKVLAGNIKAVGGQLVHLEKIEGKEYFDALIRLESISAIDTRFRGEQR